jgi:hypothetical protein
MISGLAAVVGFAYLSDGVCLLDIIIRKITPKKKRVLAMGGTGLPAWRRLCAFGLALATVQKAGAIHFEFIDQIKVQDRAHFYPPPALFQQHPSDASGLNEEYTVFELPAVEVVLMLRCLAYPCRAELLLFPLPLCPRRERLPQ